MCRIASFLFSFASFICNKFGFRHFSPFLRVTFRNSFFVLLPLVEEVRNHWNSTQQSLELRLKQLEDMVIDSLQWDDHKKETEELMRKYEARLYCLQQARRDPLNKQIAENQVRLNRYLLAILIC